MGEVRFSTESYDGCEKELISFRNANRGLARDLGYFRWRYLKRPNKAEPVIVWATDASGERVGALSVIPHHYHVGGSVERLGILGDISVSKKCRGRGIAKGMFEYLSGLKEVKDLSACVVLPNAEALKPLEKSGWVSVTRLERYVKLLSTREMIEKRLNKKMISRLISPTLDFLLKVASGEALVRSRSEYTGSTVGGSTPGSTSSGRRSIRTGWRWVLETGNTSRGGIQATLSRNTAYTRSQGARSSAATSSSIRMETPAT